MTKYYTKCSDCDEKCTCPNSKAKKAGWEGEPKTRRQMLEILNNLMEEIYEAVHNSSSKGDRFFYYNLRDDQIHKSQTEKIHELFKDPAQLANLNSEKIEAICDSNEKTFRKVPTAGYEVLAKMNLGQINRLCGE